MAAQIAIAQETELQTRWRIIANTFKESHNCIQLRIDTHLNDEKGISPFGFHFELDKDKYEERRRQLKRESVTRWLSFFALVHNKFGVRHIVLTMSLGVYVLLGGVIFNGIEAEHELESVTKTIAIMETIMHTFVHDVVNITETETNSTIRDERLLRTSKTFYKSMLSTEDRYSGSVWHKAENLDRHLIWSFDSAVFYALTLFTTIGYGSIACDTWLGRWMSVVYAIIGIPLMLLVLGDLGELMQMWITKALQFCRARLLCLLCLIRRGRSDTASTDSESCSEESIIIEEDVLEEEEETYVLPIWMATLLIIVYILVVAMFISLFDTDEYGIVEGVDFQTSLYFVFISLSTIGLGDVMPHHIQYHPLIAVAFLFGLTLISILNASIYSQMYDGFYSGVSSLEGNLEGIHRNSYKREGHRLFQQLEPAFMTLACSFPHFTPCPRPRPPTITFSDLPLRISEDSMEDSRERRGGSDSAAVVAPTHKVVRVWSALGERPRAPTLPVPGTEEFRQKLERQQRGRARAPTLGAFGGVDLTRYRQKKEKTKERSHSPRGVEKRPREKY